MDKITPEQRTGLIIGSIFSAGVNAAMGRTKREAILSAALGGTQAYSKGLQQLYDIKSQELAQERQQDLLRTSKISQMILEQDQAEKQKKKQIYESYVEKAGRPELKAIPPASGMQMLTYPRQESYEQEQNRLRKEGKITFEQFKKNITEYRSLLRKPDLEQPKPSMTAFSIADKIVPEIDETGSMLPERKDIVAKFAFEINKDPSLAKDYKRAKAKLKTLMPKKPVVQTLPLPKKPVVQTLPPSPDVQQKWNPFDWFGKYDVTQEEKEFIDVFNSLTPEQKAAATKNPKYKSNIEKLKKFLQL